MTTARLLAEIICPGRECRHVLAQVFTAPGGVLRVRHRYVGINAEQLYEDRPWVTEDLPNSPTAPGWECACKDVRTCGGRFVLEPVRVRQLAELGAAPNGKPRRWRPESADIERSDRLLPEFHINLWGAAAVRRSVLTKLTPPPPLVSAPNNRAKVVWR